MADRPPELRGPGGLRKGDRVVRIADRGIITMQLMDDSAYAWAFLDDVTGGVDDSGADACHS